MLWQYLKNNSSVLKRVSLTLFFCLFAGLALAATPTLGTVSPSYGSSLANTPTTFTSTYSDASGYAHLQTVRLLINKSLTSINAVYVHYNQNTNKLYLLNDTGTTWLGGFAPGSINMIETSYVRLDCSKTTVSYSGNTLTMKWSIVFKSTFIGTKNSYLLVQDDSGASSGWKKMGTWTILEWPSGPPKIQSVKPLANEVLEAGTPLIIYPTVNGNGILEYQFSIGSTVKQTWSNQSFYQWITAAQDAGTHTIKFEIRNQDGSDTKTIYIYLAHNPPFPQ